jgi:hypothetical protein
MCDTSGRLGERVPSSMWQELDKNIEPLDSVLYQAAKTLFAARLQQHGLWGGDYTRLKYVCRDTNRHGARDGCRYRL